MKLQTILNRIAELRRRPAPLEPYRTHKIGWLAADAGRLYEEYLAMLAERDRLMVA